MKTTLFSVIACLLIVQLAQAQDIITVRSGERVEAKVVEITPGEVKYKRFDRQAGPVYTLAKAEVLLIQYEDKTEETFEAEPYVMAEAASQPAGANLYGQGQLDAGSYYKGYKGAGTGTLVTSLLSPLVGLIPAVACSVTTPKEQNLDYPSHELMQNQDYKNGYKQSSRKIKSRKVWTNWGIGLGANIALVLLLAQQ